METTGAAGTLRSRSLELAIAGQTAHRPAAPSLIEPSDKPFSSIRRQRSSLTGGPQSCVEIQSSEDAESPTDPRIPLDRPRRSLLWHLWATKVWRVYPFLILNFMSGTSLMGILPIYITNFFANRRAEDSEVLLCEQFPLGEQPTECQDAHADAVLWSSMRDLISLSLIGFLLTPVIGRLSDSHGRKPFLVMAAWLGALPQLVVLLSCRNMGSFLWHYPMVALAKSIDVSSLAVAAIADVLPPELRGTGIGFVTACFATAILGGPMMGAGLSIRQVSWLAISLNAAAILWAHFLLSETTSESGRMSAQQNQQATGGDSCWRGLWATWRIVTRSRLFATLTIIMMVVGLAQEGMLDLIMQYLQLKIGFMPTDNAAMFLILGVGGITTQVVLLRPLILLIGEKGLLILGVAAQMTTQTIFAIANTKPQAFAAVVMGCFGMLAFPAISTIKSNNSAEHEQGAVQGALFGAKAVATGTGPLIFAVIFAAFTRSDSKLPYMPGVPFLFGALLLAICTILSCSLPRSCAKHQSLLAVSLQRGAAARPGQQARAPHGAPGDLELLLGETDGSGGLTLSQPSDQHPASD